MSSKQDNERTVGEKAMMSSGIEIVIEPFPARLWEDINIKAHQDFPDPQPPTKVIETVNGEEEVEDANNPEYLKKLKEVSDKRANILGDAVLDLCVQLDIKQYEPKIKQVEKYTQPFPEDPEERRLKFLTDYVLRTKGDYELVMVSATSQMMVSSPEVEARLEFFRSEVERTSDNGAETSSPNEG